MKPKHTQAGEYKPCSGEFCRSIQEMLNYYCLQLGLPPCSAVPTIENGELCYCFCECSGCSRICQDKVAKLGGVLCPAPFCSQIQERLNQYCLRNGQRLGTPVPQLYDGQVCWCCCDCAPNANWLIEVEPDRYTLIDDLSPRDRVLAGSLVEDGKVVWTSSSVELLPGIGPSVEFDSLFYLSLTDRDDAESWPTFLVVSRDHLFLGSCGNLKPVQYLIPADELQRPDGGIKQVEFVTAVTYIGSINQLFFPDFDGTSLNGHLLSINNTVSADFSVQLAYSTGRLNEEFIDPSARNSALTVNDPAYQTKHANAALAAFLEDTDNWPQGIVPAEKAN